MAGSTTSLSASKDGARLSQSGTTLHFYRISWMVHLDKLSHQTLVETLDFLLEQSTPLYIFISGVSNYK